MNDNPKNFNLSDFLPYRLSIISNRISLGISEIYVKNYELTMTEWRTMAILGTFPNSTASEIVQKTAMDKVAISRAVKKLLKRDFIEREIDSEDRRRQTLRLSESGYKVYNEIIPKAQAYQNQFESELDVKDFDDLERIATKLAKSF